MTKNNSPQNSNYSLEAEQSVIGGLILKNDALPDVSNVLSLDDFYDKRHQLLFKAIQNLASQGQPFDPVTLSEQLQKDGTLNAIGGGAYLGQLATNTPSAANIMAYARIVKKKSIERQAVVLANNPLENADKLLALRDAKALLDAPKEELVFSWDLLQMNIPKKELILFPWLFTRDIWMIHAWRGVGKSQIALEIAFSIATGTTMLDGRWYAPKPYRIAYFDGEMGAEELQDRIHRMMKTHHVTDKELINNLFIYTPDLFKTQINLTTIEGQAHVNRFMDRRDTEIAIMDNLSTLAGGIDENSAKEFQPVQDWMVERRSVGKGIGIINHSNKSGAQRGTSKHEDVLNASINLRKPENDDESLMFRGARFELHFEKTRGKTQTPFIASLPEETIPEIGQTEGVWIIEEIDKRLPKPTATEELFLDAILNGADRIPIIADEIGKSISSCKVLGNKLKKKGLVTANNGIYSVVNHTEVNHQINHVNHVNHVNHEIDNEVNNEVNNQKLTKEANDDVVFHEEIGEVNKLTEDNTVNKKDGRQGKAETKGKPLNGKFVPLEVFITENRHRNLDVSKYLKKKATVQGTVQDHYYLKFVAAFKNEYKRNAGRVIRKVADEMKVGYPFSKTMGEILDSKEVQKEIHHGWARIKTRLSSQYGEDELEISKDELIEAGFIEYNVQKQTLKLLDN